MLVEEIEFRGENRRPRNLGRPPHCIVYTSFDPCKFSWSMGLGRGGLIRDGSPYTCIILSPSRSIAWVSCVQLTFLQILSLEICHLPFE